MRKGVATRPCSIYEGHDYSGRVFLAFYCLQRQGRRGISIFWRRLSLESLLRTPVKKEKDWSWEGVIIGSTVSHTPDLWVDPCVG